jgi:hypothetical protein
VSAPDGDPDFEFQILANEAKHAGLESTAKVVDLDSLPRSLGVPKPNYSFLFYGEKKNALTIDIGSVNGCMRYYSRCCGS